MSDSKPPNLGPCASGITTLLATIPQGQRKQLKPVIIAMRRVFTAHIDQLHGEVSQLRAQVGNLYLSRKGAADEPKGPSEQAPGGSETEPGETGSPKPVTG